MSWSVVYSLQDAECHGSKSFFTEIIASISDIKFTNDGKHILSRDYMNLKVTDPSICNYLFNSKVAHLFLFLYFVASLQ